LQSRRLNNSLFWKYLKIKNEELVRFSKNQARSVFQEMVILQVVEQESFDSG